MADKMISPDFIFESSWEVCNKIGGIYTVLSTRAKTLQDMLKDKIVFIGPDVWMNRENPLFIEDKKLWPRHNHHKHANCQLGTYSKLLHRYHSLWHNKG